MDLTNDPKINDKEPQSSFKDLKTDRMNSVPIHIFGYIESYSVHPKTVCPHRIPNFHLFIHVPVD